MIELARSKAKPVAALLLAAALAGCKHDNAGQAGAPDLSVDTNDLAGTVRIDDLAGLEAAICGTNSKKAEQVGLDLVFAIDNSYSMDFNLKWAEVSTALESFINDPKFAGLGVGIQYFPLRLQCDSQEYATPAVPVGVLPTVAPALLASISGRRMSGGTPLVPALTGILQYASTVNPAGSSRRTVVVLATDGAPDNTCLPADDGGTAQDPIKVSASLVQAAASSNPPINTYVIGVGADLSALNTIAQAGGGAPTAFLVDTAGDIEAQFRAALDAIRKKALVCNFQIPMPAPGTFIDYSKVNVTYADLTTAPEPFVFVANQAGCTQAPNTGWYYDDPTTPTQVVLCDGACDLVRNGEMGDISIVFGCETIIP
jgi:von Willebrand factor type A domain